MQRIKNAFFNMMHSIKTMNSTHNHITVIALIIQRAKHISNTLEQTAILQTHFLCRSLQTHTPQRPQKLLHKLTQRGHEITWMNQVHLLTQTQCVHSVHPSPSSILSRLMPSSLLPSPLLSSPYSSIPALHPWRYAGKSSAGQFWPCFKLPSSSLWITGREEVGE